MNIMIDKIFMITMIMIIMDIINIIPIMTMIFIIVKQLMRNTPDVKMHHRKGLSHIMYLFYTFVFVFFVYTSSILQISKIADFKPGLTRI